MKKLYLFLIVTLVLVGLSKAQIQTYKLENGLTVILNEDHSQPTVLGNVVVRAGAVNESDVATGLAHYLEHVMFKGTEKIGTTNWNSEKVHYNNIIELYDQLSVATTEDEIKSIQTKINEESLLAGNFTINNEFSNLVQSIGGTNLNAATGYDMTQYFNVFPSFQIEKWLKLYVERFTNPVFRGFQAELETVYEEKNMYSDSPFEVIKEEFFKEMYGSNNPYARPIGGYSEHLKKPSLSKLIQFYQTHYVPVNMALILSGDIDPLKIKPLIEQTFGQLEHKEHADDIDVKSNVLEKKKYVRKNITPFPLVMIGFNGLAASSEERFAADILSNILTNSNNTGLLDKLVIDGDVQQLAVGFDRFEHDGAIRIIGIPRFDMAQMKFESLTVVEDLIVKTLKGIDSIAIQDWLLQSVKDNLVMEHELMKESALSSGMELGSYFGNGISVDEFFNYPKKIQSVSKQEIVDLAKKYFTNNYLTLLSQKGKIKKDNLEKPPYKPIVPAAGQVSEFAQTWLKESATIPDIKFVDFQKDIQQAKLAEGVKLFYTANPSNDIFTMTIKYGVGSHQIPGLNFSVQLMNKAGIMAQFSSYELKREFSKLGCSCQFYNDQSYTYVILQGKESSLAKACQLLSKTYLLPSLDEKQMNSLLGSELGNRSLETTEKDIQTAALVEYLMYGKQSNYLNRLSNQEIRDLTVSKLAADFIQATQYETSIHYTGKYSFEVIQNVLKRNMAFPADLKKSESPVDRKLAEVKESTVYLINNKDARQSDVVLFVPSSKFDLQKRPVYNAFNQYFGGSFNGIVLQELRELRSFAYTASGEYVTPSRKDGQCFLIGDIGVQDDKTTDAVSEFMKLIQTMPEKPERIDNIKSYLYQSVISSTPSNRELTQVVERWINFGYEQDPRIDLVKSYNNLTFDQLVDFYRSEIQNKPIGIAIVGNTKKLSMPDLKLIGNVKTISPKDLFKY